MRGFMNGREEMQLMLVGNVTVTTFHTCYPYSFYIECTFLTVVKSFQIQM